MFLFFSKYKKGKWAEHGRVMPGCRTEPKKIDQILNDGSVVCTSDDQKFTQNEISELLLECFEDCEVQGKRPSLKPLSSNGHEVRFYTRNITHLGGDWGSEKKRIQVGTDFPNFYKSNKEANIETVLLGIYHYYPDGHSGVTLFVCFSPNTYAARTTNNSAAHIHTVDLLNAYEKGVYRRLDRSGNELLVLDKINFIKHINCMRGAEEVASIKNDREVLAYLGGMFDSLPKTLIGIDCFKEMMAAKDAQRMNQGAWEGWYYEFFVERYLKNNPTDKILWWSKKGSEQLDFDLKFTYQDWFYGDVKSDDINKDVQGNLKDNIDFLVREKGGRLWYVAIDFTAEKDAAHDFITTRWWNERLGKKDKPFSYGARMKYSISVKGFSIYEITRHTMRYLKQYNVSPCAGKARRPKYKIQNKMKEFLRIYART